MTEPEEPEEIDVRAIELRVLQAALAWLRDDTGEAAGALIAALNEYEALGNVTWCFGPNEPALVTNSPEVMIATLQCERQKAQDQAAEFLEACRVAEERADSLMARMEVERSYHEETKGYRQHEEQLRKDAEAELADALGCICAAGKVIEEMCAAGLGQTVAPIAHALTGTVLEPKKGSDHAPPR